MPARLQCFFSIERITGVVVGALLDRSGKLKLMCARCCDVRDVYRHVNAFGP